MNPPFWKPDFVDRNIGDRIIVSCGTEPHYFEQLHSTREHCTKYVPEAWQLFYYGYPDGCPPQHARQYAFKIYALERAFAAGFAELVWLDAAFQPIASVEPLWREMTLHGWYVHVQGDAVLGNWCGDYALSVFGITRDVAMTIPLCYSGLVGLNVRHATGNRIYQRWCELFRQGTFDGPHLNQPGTWEPWGNKFAGPCSSDPRCTGHRHDEAALSYILWEMGLTPRHEPFIEINGQPGFIGHHRKLVCL